MWKSIFAAAALLSLTVQFLEAYPSSYNDQFLLGQSPNVDRRQEHQQQMKVFDSMQFGGPFGVSKRNLRKDYKKNRRGTFDSLSLGNSFGRASKRGYKFTTQDTFLDKLENSILKINGLPEINDRLSAKTQKFGKGMFGEGIEREQVDGRLKSEEKSNSETSISQDTDKQKLDYSLNYLKLFPRYFENIEK